MADLHEDSATLSREWVVSAHGRAAQPAAFRICAMFVLKGAVQHENLLTADMNMRLEYSARRPADEGYVFCAEFMQRHDA